jgi:hypothetical protein
MVFFKGLAENQWKKTTISNPKKTSWASRWLWEIDKRLSIDL